MRLLSFNSRTEGTRSLLGLAPIALACAAFALVSVQAPPKKLEVTRSVATVWPGPTHSVILGPVTCDSKGDLYLRAVATVGGHLDNAAPVVSVTAAGSRGPTFNPSDIPAHRKQMAIVGNFTVGAAGRVYFVSRVCPTTTGSCHAEVARFAASGRYEGSTSLAGPDFDPQELTVFEDGGFLVAGFSGSGENPLSSYTAIYNAGGKLVAQVKLLGDAKPPSLPAGPVGQGTGISFLANDGHGDAYLVRPVVRAVLFKINRRGAVLGRFPVTPPFANGVPVAIRYAGAGRVLLQFAERTPEGITASGYFFSLVDAKNGQTLSRYTADEYTGGLLGCYLPSSGIEFLSRQAGGRTAIRFDKMP